MRIRLPNFYKGLPSDFKPIFPGDYDSDDERLYGLADYLVKTGQAEALDAPLPFRETVAAKTVEEKRAASLETMTVNELHAFAAEYGVELGGARRRDDILAALHRWLAVMPLSQTVVESEEQSLAVTEDEDDA